VRGRLHGGRRSGGRRMGERARSRCGGCGGYVGGAAEAEAGGARRGEGGRGCVGFWRETDLWMTGWDWGSQVGSHHPFLACEQRSLQMTVCTALDLYIFRGSETLKKNTPFNLDV
jgi:hypothetical protein